MAGWRKGRCPCKSRWWRLEWQTAYGPVRIYLSTFLRNKLTRSKRSKYQFLDNHSLPPPWHPPLPLSSRWSVACLRWTPNRSWRLWFSRQLCQCPTRFSLHSCDFSPSKSPAILTYPGTPACTWPVLLVHYFLRWGWWYWQKFYKLSNFFCSMDQHSSTCLNRSCTWRRLVPASFCRPLRSSIP